MVQANYLIMITYETVKEAVETYDRLTLDIAKAFFVSEIVSLPFDDYWDFVCMAQRVYLHREIDNKFKLNDVKKLIDLYEKTGVLINTGGG